MLVYIITLLILICPYLAKGVLVRDNSRSRLCMYFLILSLISGLSFYLGADTRGLTSGHGYVDTFKSIPSISNLTSQDFSDDRMLPGFVVIMSFFRTLSPNYIWYQLFHAFLINFIVVYFVKKNTPYVGLCLFFYCMLYYLDLNFEIQRESYAIVLGLLMYIFLEKHNGILAKAVSIGVAVLAFLFLHKSAFILVLYPLLKDVKINKLGILICLVITLLIQAIWMRFPELGTLIDVVAGDTYRGYIHNEVQESNAGIGIVFFIWISFWRVVIPFAFLYLSYKNSNPRYLVFVAISIMFENLIFFSFAFHRMYGYFTPFYWLVLTDGVIYLGKRVNMMKKTGIRVAFIACMMVFIISIYHGDYFREDPYPTSNTSYVYNWYFPYQSVLEPGNSYLNSSW